MEAQRALLLALDQEHKKTLSLALTHTLTEQDREQISRACYVPYYRTKFQAARRSLFDWGLSLVMQIAPEATEVIDAMRDAGPGGQEMVEILLKTEDIRKWL